MVTWSLLPFAVCRKRESQSLQYWDKNPPNSRNVAPHWVSFTYLPYTFQQNCSWDNDWTTAYMYEWRYYCYKHKPVFCFSSWRFLRFPIHREPVLLSSVLKRTYSSKMFQDSLSIFYMGFPGMVNGNLKHFETARLKHFLCEPDGNLREIETL